MRISSFFLIGLFTAIFLSGCGIRANSQSFLREDVDLGYIARIAVLPLENHSKDEYAGARSRDIITTQVLALGLFDVMEKGLVDSILREEAVEPGSAIDLHTLKRIGQRLNVQALLLGSVDQAGENRRGASIFPELSLTLRLVDSQAGLVLWQASGHGSGYSLTDRLFGLTPRDSFQVALVLVEELLSSVPARSVSP